MNAIKLRAGFSIFEIIAVMTIMGILTLALLGSFRYWGTAHALTGAVNIMSAAIDEAETIARENQQIVGFRYGNDLTNSVKSITSFQTFLCSPTNEVDSLEAVEEIIKQHSESADLYFDMVNDDSEIKVINISPKHLLPSDIRLVPVTLQSAGDDGENIVLKEKEYETATLFFRPDGSAFSLHDDDKISHAIKIETRKHFAVIGKTEVEPIYRLLRIDLASGTTSVTTPNHSEDAQ
ncbi:MAG: type II secretion system protein [Kiritimatiellae bacterium]|nr:type II secretion system protein [Kiritimatiellia bacterium]